jgi:hypothetical protein
MPRSCLRHLGGLLLGLALASPLAFAAQPVPAAPLQQVFGAREYDARIATPDTLLGFAHGSQAATPEEIHAALLAWAAQSDRLRVHTYARSHQGRPLSVAIVSSPANLARLDALQDELDELADPRRTSEARAREIIARAPAVAYIAHSIHGNETSGGDAALGLVYHLIAGNDGETRALLDSTIVIVDPLLNPDGRARAVGDLRGFRTAQPSHDGQQLARGTSWPFGRGNHYVFDLNRDWIYGTQPETRGRLALLKRWHPLLFVDAHEMGAQDTFLFSPPRAPVNRHFPPRFREYLERFSRDQAEAFDRRGWVYYSGEWNEGWYPGYSDAWGGMRGAVNILYEQARVADHGVRQANGQVLHYSEGVARQLGSAWANLQSLRANHRQLLQAFWDDRKQVTGGSGEYTRRLYAIPGDAHPTRLATLLDLLALQNIEVYRTTREWRPGAATDTLGRRTSPTLPAGSLIVPNRQPLARLVANLFEFDQRIDEGSLRKEREELLRTGSGTMYDVTAWNLPMMFGVQAYTLEGGMPGDAERVGEPAVAGAALPAASEVGYLIPGHDDGALRAASALLQAGLQPRVALKPLELDGRRYPRGSVVVTRYDHRDRSAEDLRQALAAALPHLREGIVALRSGQGPGDFPDLGGGEFGLLQAPRVAILGKGAVGSQNFGFVWHYLEHGLGLTPTLLDEAALARTDLRPYNVIVLPERSGPLDSGVRDALKGWTEAGGTLVAIGAASAALAMKDGPVKARTLDTALEDLAPYRGWLAREWLATQAGEQVGARLWSHAAVAGQPAPWPSDIGNDKDDLKAREAREQWRRLFAPRGAFLAARCADTSWLTLGCDGVLPVLVDANAPLMAGDGVEAPFRLGAFVSGGDKREWTAFGWAGIPPGQSLHLRMSGLLWPEAQERLANTAWLTREALGRGQVILFATTPVFRGASHGMQRVLGNAVVLGPGLGASAPILP